MRFATRGLPPMVEALDAMAEAGGARPRVGMFYDTSTLSNAVRGAEPRGERADLTTDRGRALFHDTVIGFFERVPERHWARHRGRPLVVMYTSGFAARWDETLCSGLRDAFAARFDGERPFVVSDVSCGDVGQDATTQWGAALSGPFVHGSVAQIGPGYDDSPVPGRQTPHRPREGGAFYAYSWREAIAARPELVLIETWNEMHEGTEICRTVESGGRYLELTRDGVERLRKGEPEPEVALRFDAPQPRPDRSWGADAAGLDAVTWRPDAQLGLRPIGWEDGPIHVGDEGLRAVCPEGRPVTYVYLQVSDHWAFDDALDLAVTMRVQRTGGGSLAIDYDSRDRAAVLGGAYARAPGTAGDGDAVTFRLPRARLANRQNGGADLRVVVHGGTLAIRDVRIARQ